jgi:MFS family permease
VKGLFSAAVIVAALGYFVDIYDLILFTIVRTTSLRDLGLEGDVGFRAGVLLLNTQLVGMLLGGALWGVLGDKLGRMQALFASIVTYSLANLANAFVTGVKGYAACRFIAGIGLAGELGAGITLVSELVGPAARGWATTLVATVGMGGALFAVTLSRFLGWRSLYVTGGLLGLSLLVARVRVADSALFERVRNGGHVRGKLAMLVSTPKRFVAFASCVAVGVPIWFIVGVLITFAPELTSALAVTGRVEAADAVFWFYAGVACGDVASGALSQWRASRKQAVVAFLLLEACAAAAFLTARGASVPGILALSCFAGFSTGYWAVLVTLSAEHFGTNLRATAATVIPNVIRATAVPITLGFSALSPRLGVVGAAAIVGTGCLTVAALGTKGLRETFARDLEFVDT